MRKKLIIFRVDGMDVIVLLLSPGISIPSEDVAKIVKGCTDVTYLDQPNVISKILFDPKDRSKFVSDEPIVDQCRHAILQIPLNRGSREVDQKEASRCKVVWIVSDSEVAINSPDGIGIISLYGFCAKMFTSKTMIILTAGKVPIDVASYCFAQCSPFARVLFGCFDNFLTSKQVGII